MRWPFLHQAGVCAEAGLRKDSSSDDVRRAGRGSSSLEEPCKVGGSESWSVEAPAPSGASPALQDLQVGQETFGWLPLHWMQTWANLHGLTLQSIPLFQL